jgi:ribosomal protein S18 acetylase RimI-like enzyme
MIEYRHTATDLQPGRLEGFFQGWPHPPTPETHLRLLESSDEVILAVDRGREVVAGFITAVTDGVLAAYIPLLEVRPAYRRKGIGTELLRRMLGRLEHLYMIDLVCDESQRPFYRRTGMREASAMIVRNRSRSSGVPVL